MTAKGTEACAPEAGNQTVVSAKESLVLTVWFYGPRIPRTTPSPLGLFVANSSNGALTNPSKDYCLYETKAPAGYTGAAVKTVNVKAGTTAISNVSVTNTQKEGPKLPLTGAQGTLLMVVGGLVLVAAGTGAVVATRKRPSCAGLINNPESC